MDSPGRMLLTFFACVLIAACTPHTTNPASAHIADRANARCRVTFDGSVWYALPLGAFAPIEYARSQCDTAKTALPLEAREPAPVAHWAIPRGTTRAIFIAASLQEDYAPVGMRELANVARAAHVPMTWMVNDPRYLQFDAAFYNDAHARYGDDVEIANNLTIFYYARALPWFTGVISVDGAGRERRVENELASGARGFWGITWNSLGTDATSDRGAPPGAYCADHASYKRPDPRGTCALAAFEWTARDLTRAYLGDAAERDFSAEAAYSTDPDDLIDRGGFTSAQATRYVERLVDAYAAAGQTTPLVMLAQQESIDEERHDARDAPVLRAMYQRAKRDGMRAVTLREAAALLPSFAAKARAIAFPFLSGGRSTTYDGTNVAPGTIDYRDAHVGMTFLAGHTLPSRIVDYANASVSRFDRALPHLDAGSADAPQLVSLVVERGALRVTLKSAHATRGGIAIWSDPKALGLTEPDVTFAGRAGFVIAFDLAPGLTSHAIRCPRCASATFTYAR